MDEPETNSPTRPQFTSHYQTLQNITAVPLTLIPPQTSVEGTPQHWQINHGRKGLQDYEHIPCKDGRRCGRRSPATRRSTSNGSASPRPLPPPTLSPTAGSHPPCPPLHSLGLQLSAGIHRNAPLVASFRPLERVHGRRLEYADARMRENAGICKARGVPSYLPQPHA
jgi:hypothetical protein